VLRVRKKRKKKQKRKKRTATFKPEGMELIRADNQDTVMKWIKPPHLRGGSVGC